MEGNRCGLESYVTASLSYWLDSTVLISLFSKKTKQQDLYVFLLKH